MKEKGEKKTVFLPAELYSKVEERVKATNFGSVDEYVEFVLEEVVKEDEGEKAFSEEEEKEVKKRLKDLGYLA
ncbi:MAG: CopG family transcriptional regulator [Proteobacteria bacterium]|nr:CopG family transcriptional regulator [Pseudomonadota bacterium]